MKYASLSITRVAAQVKRENAAARVVEKKGQPPDRPSPGRDAREAEKSAAAKLACSGIRPQLSRMRN